MPPEQSQNGPHTFRICFDLTDRSSPSFVRGVPYVVDRVVKDFRAPSQEVAIMAWRAWALTKGGDVGAMHYVNQI